MRMIYLLTIATCLSSVARSQCTIPGGLPSEPDCATASQLTVNANITSGTTYSDRGTSGANFSGVSVNGGTLVLCGNTTFTDLSFNSGIIYIKAGAQITFNTTIPGATFNGSGNAFYNFGMAAFNLDVACNQNGVVYNEQAATIAINGSLTINQGNFYNNGVVTANSTTINVQAPAGAICLGPLSSTNVTSILNNSATDPVTYQGTGSGCIGYGGSFTGTKPITASSNVIICVLPGASSPDPAVIGSAHVQDPCTSCNAALPLKLVSFTGKEIGTEAQLQWITAMEYDLRYFVVEKSTDGRVFQSIDTIPAHNQPSSYIFNTRIDTTTLFRLKMVDIDGKFTYSAIVVMGSPAPGLQLLLLSNPILSSGVNVSIDVPGDQQGQMSIMDDLGRVLKKVPVSLKKGRNDLRLDLTGISGGHYFLFFMAGSNKSRTIPFIKL
ncbi:MAG TPA: hypothetical protein VHD83_05175 [Puia sp.]|nr:hypothetical protein [Puia sp.]